MSDFEPAFPTAIAAGPSGDVYHGFNGMSLRDWFAGQALGGILANSENVHAGAEPTNCALSCTPEEFSGWAARVSYLVADAMLATRTPDADAGEGR